MPRINVMHVLYSLEIGGLEQLVLTLTERLNRGCFSCAVCSLSGAGALEPRFIAAGVPVQHCMKKKGIDFGLYFRLAGVLKKHRIDIVHTHNVGPWFYGAFAGRLAGVRAVVHTEHSNVFTDRRGLLTAEQWLARATDVVISDAAKVTRQLVEAQRIDPRRVQTIPNGIDLEKFSAATVGDMTKEMLAIPAAAPVVGCVARLEPVKDHDYLLAGFKLLRAEFPQARLVLVGDGSLREQLAARAAELGIREQVVFLGARADIPALLPLFDVFVLSSRSEGMSISILEAMAAGRPVVATAVGGNPELVVDGQTGFLCPVGQPDQLSAAIASLLRDSSRARQLGQAGALRAREYFSLERMVREYEQVYQRCLRRNAIAAENC